jgi:hypothetical protein
MHTQERVGRFLGAGTSEARARGAAILWLCGAAFCCAACSGSSDSSSASDAAADATTPDGTASAEDGTLGDGRLPPIAELNADAPGGGMSVQCGATMCSPPAAGAVVSLGACCLPDGGCGASLGMLPAAGAGGAADSCLDTAPGTPDPTCPSMTTMGFLMKGCCSAVGVCGVDLSVIGLGCISSISGFPGMAMDAAPPQPCGDAATSGTPESVDAASQSADGAPE